MAARGGRSRRSRHVLVEPVHLAAVASGVAWMARRRMVQLEHHHAVDNGRHVAARTRLDPCRSRRSLSWLVRIGSNTACCEWAHAELLHRHPRSGII